MVAAAAAQLTAKPEMDAGRAALAARQAALDAAVTTADAARAARAARAVAATTAAAGVAESAAHAVEAVRADADELAEGVAAAALQAALTVANLVVAGGDAEALRAARAVEATVVSTAIAKAEEVARAAVLVAREVAAAAATVAATTAAAADAMEHEVLDAAFAVHEVTTATARELAADTLKLSAAADLAARAVVAASDAAAAARLHEEREKLRRAGLHDRSIALALQHAMLTRLPDPDNLHLAVLYLTAAQDHQISGDWYDAILLPAGTTLVIGDVAGRGIHAAATMVQLRNILRALAWRAPHPPANVVACLDRAIADLGIDTTATMILMNIEPPTADHPGSVATLRWSNAGHPAPILVHADGTAILLEDASGPQLGVHPDTIRHDHTHPVPPGATVLLYTDGLVQTRTRSIDIGQRRLLDAVRTHHQLQPENLLDAVLTDMVDDRLGDDIAVLAARFHTPPNPAAAPGPADLP